MGDNKNRSPIPLCRSAFLQDVTIALGRKSLKSLRRSNPHLSFQVAYDDDDGPSIERFDVEARDHSERLTKIVLWEDGTSWVYCRERKMKRTPSRHIFEIRANLVSLSPGEVAELVRETLADPEAASETWKEHANQNRGH